jgi:mevalonate kinase
MTAIMTKSFETRTFGKWILAGEHAVLRGCPALVFPLTSKWLELNYLATDENLKLDLAGERGEELKLLFWGVLEKACELKNINRSDLKGDLRLKSAVPVGAGMGASAAFCVAMARWFENLGHVKKDEIYEFSRTLENLFHGESSGVDIAVAMTAKPLLFIRDGDRRELDFAWKPRMYISYSGKRGVTVDCVNKVKALLAQNPTLGEKIDREMKKAVEICKTALFSESGQGNDRLNQLAEGIDLASHCFQQWGLNEGEPDKHMMWLRENGALAVKPTGSGGGGYILSLWDHEPPTELINNLVLAAVF